MTWRSESSESSQSKAKDLRIALSDACANGARLPVAALVDEFYADIQSMDGGPWDTSSLIRRLPRRK